MMMKINETAGERMKRELGGTILGLIIGVVLGLGAALAVAIYVAKVPSPFVNKGQSRSADQDAVEAKKNRNWDPNAPLYGKNPAKPAATAPAPAVPPVAVDSAAATPAAPAVAGGPGTAVKAEMPKIDAAKIPATRSEAPATPPAAAADPLGDLARAKSSSSGSEPFVYFVQVGAYRNSEDAESQRAKLSLSGVEAKVTEREQSGRAIFRVRVGPFNTKDDAERNKEKLDGAGLDTALVRVQR